MYFSLLTAFFYKKIGKRQGTVVANNPDTSKVSIVPYTVSNMLQAGESAL